MWFDSKDIVAGDLLPAKTSVKMLVPPIITRWHCNKSRLRLRVTSISIKFLGQVISYDMKNNLLY